MYIGEISLIHLKYLQCFFFESETVRIDNFKVGKCKINKPSMEYRFYATLYYAIARYRYIEMLIIYILDFCLFCPCC